MTRDRALAVWTKYHSSGSRWQVSAAGLSWEEALRAWTLPDHRLGELAGVDDMALIYEFGAEGRKNVLYGAKAFFDRSDEIRLPHAMHKLNLRAVDQSVEALMIRALDHQRYDVRSTAAIALLSTRTAGYPKSAQAKVVRNLREALATETDSHRLREAGLALYQRVGNAALPDLQKARRRTHSKALDIELARVGDSEVLPRIRILAMTNRIALDALLESRGKSERSTALKGLKQGAEVRLRSAQWLASWGDKSAISAMRTASKSSPPDVANSSKFESVGLLVGYLADAIAQGKKPAVPDAFELRRGSQELRPRLRNWDQTGMGWY